MLPARACWLCINPQKSKKKNIFPLSIFPYISCVYTGGRQERDSHHGQRQRASVYLETVNLTFFLLGSNLAREEIIVTKCGVSLLRHVEPVQKHRPVVGRVMSQPANVVDRAQFTGMYSLYDHN